MESNLRALETRLAAIDSRGSKGDFEEGYTKGFRDANKLGSASAARRRLDDDYGSKTDRFHEGYIQGLRDAGMTGMSTSMSNIANKGAQSGGYSAGYMQGFRDGNSGIFGDRISTTLLRRLEEQYPNQDEFRTGYIEGFKEGAGSRTSERREFEDSRRLQRSLTELTERLTSLEKTKGDEIHSTKIFHVYNQQPDTIGYSTSGQQLASELEEINSTSRRSTLRRHYTPGDYLKYGTDLEGYGSLGRARRSLSASALGRDGDRHPSGTGTASYISRASAEHRATTDTFGRRYNYRSRSDMGSPRRYASQTLLDGSRPGPATPHARRDALHHLQRELDNLSSPDPRSATPRGGYGSDTGHLTESLRSRARGGGYSNIDYDSFHASRSERSEATRTAAGMPPRVPYPSTSTPAKKVDQSGHNWPDDLMDIVQEPMTETLQRMKKYSSNSTSQVDRGEATTSSSDHRVKEIHSSDARQ